MKKLLVLLITVLFCAVTASAQNKTNFTTDGGVHVITGAAVSGCATCHTPHSGAHSAVLLWALAYPGGGTPTSFNTYQGSVITATPGTLTAPATGTDATAHSYLCLSCHDGTAATANFGVSGYLTGSTQVPTGTALITGVSGSTLTDDHPVNFVYPDPMPAGIPTGAYAALTTLQAPASNVRLFGATNNSVQCATCHDPHKQNPVTTGKFLRTLTTTALCVTCHL